jgi:hypothetical protein
MKNIDALARTLYDRCPTVKPAWEQIGEATRSTWRESAQRYAAGDPQWWSCMPPKPTEARRQVAAEDQSPLAVKVPSAETREAIGETGKIARAHHGRLASTGDLFDALEP